MSIMIENSIGARLRNAERTAEPIAPFAVELGTGNIAGAYRVQHANTEHAIASGRVFRGRKIGLTARAVQEQLGVNEPDYGALLVDMEIVNGGTLKLDELISPRIEAEIGLVIARDIDHPGLSPLDLEAHVDHAVSALEIVDSRLKDWRIGILDTIADNGASARFVLGSKQVPIRDVDLARCRMQLMRNGEVVSTGIGKATLGHPLKALAWLVDTLIDHGRPLRAGDLVLTGALGPVASLASGDRFEATFEGLSPVAVNVL